MSSLLKLYATPLSANGRKTLAVIRHLHIDAEVHSVDVYRGEGRSREYLAINRHGKIPFLVDGEFVLSESNAILLYLAERYGGERLWPPGDARSRGKIAQWLFWESAHWQPALIALLSPIVGHRLLPEKVPAPQALPEWRSPPAASVLDTLEAACARQAFIAGSELTLADYSIAGMMTYFKATAFPGERFPNICAWYARIEALEAWQFTQSPLWA